VEAGDVAEADDSRAKLSLRGFGAAARAPGLRGGRRCFFACGLAARRRGAFLAFRHVPPAFQAFNITPNIDNHNRFFRARRNARAQAEKTALYQKPSEKDCDKLFVSV